MNFAIPTLKTERLTLRPHKMADFDSLAAMLATPHVKYMGGPMNRKAAWKSFCSDIAQWALLGHGAWAVERRDTGEFIGQITIIKPPHFPETEIGWVFFPQSVGNGFACEAARAALIFAFDTIKLKTLVSYIDPGNTRSIALAERLGAKLDPTALSTTDIDHVYRHAVQTQ